MCANKRHPLDVMYRPKAIYKGHDQCLLTNVQANGSRVRHFSMFVDNCVSCIQATTDARIPCLMTLSHCLHAKGVVQSPSPKTEKGCTLTMVDTIVQFLTSAKRYAHTTIDVAVHD